ncbi:tryptophan synthase subunit alpha [Thorsellia anophelis]|uniref:Tryptophan synthase alpha chain n=1 Tax=Thorsellia anophelis DSM 18579 TaxID=1123402 RepID=A0A1I0DS77_9GAMM|nr:tryptophan synthase subunit alpha [Thorsellia anophelis]SET35452.1 tryptophan synthase, alpha chain [Thorsellia anophelis DSM 18579]
MNRYKRTFDTLAAKKQGAFVPFVTIGDPSIEVSKQIIQTLIDAGADALELGIPFSDPLADGPTIQNATLRAFASGVTTEACFGLLKEIRQSNPDIPIGLLMYANLVFSNGIDTFYQKCQQTGIDSVLIADVPFEESEPFRESAIKHGIAPIFICPPNATEQLIQDIAKAGQGYTYFLSRAGVTGAETRANIPASHLIESLKKANAAPALQGFGISEPSQVKEAIEAGAAGAISGSAIVKIIETHLEDVPMMLGSLSKFVSSLKAATHY